MADAGGGDGARQAAIGRIKAKRAFMAGVVSFVVVNLILWLIWAATGGGYPWPMWITGFWGLGLIFGAWGLFGQKPITDAQIDKEMGRGG